MCVVHRIISNGWLKVTPFRLSSPGKHACMRYVQYRNIGTPNNLKVSAHVFIF